MLEILICTIDERIRKVPQVLLPPREGVCYLVSWQQTAGKSTSPLPDLLTGRPDVRVVGLEGKGLSANRNNAIRHAKGDILLISDDDARYRPVYFDTIVQSFGEHPQADILTFQIVDEDGRPFRQYAESTYEYKERPRFCSSVRSLEIAFRRTSPVPSFDLRFGLGSEYLACGEEEVFVHQASMAGLRVEYIPRPIVQTRQGTTGSRFLYDERVRRSKGAVLCLFHGVAGALLRSLKFSFLASKGNPALLYRILLDMCKGIVYIKKTAR